MCSSNEFQQTNNLPCVVYWSAADDQQRSVHSSSLSVCLSVWPSITHLSVFFSTTFVHDGLLLLLLFSSVSFLEMKAAADAFDLPPSPTFPGSPPAPPVFELTLVSFLPPTFTSTVTAWPAVACWTLPLTFDPLFMSMLAVVVFFSSLLAVLSDWKKLSLDCRVFAAVVEVRGAGVGLGVTVVVVVKVDSAAVREGVGLETKDVWVSLAAEKRLEAGREGDGVEKVLEKLGVVLGFSVSHVGPSLEGVLVEVPVLVFVASGAGVNLGAGVFVGKSLKGADVFVGDSNLKRRNHKLVLIFFRLINPFTDFNQKQLWSLWWHDFCGSAAISFISWVLTWRSSCDRASRPAGVAAPGERACCRTHICYLRCPSDWTSQPERPRRGEGEEEKGFNKVQMTTATCFVIFVGFVKAVWDRNNRPPQL